MNFDLVYIYDKNACMHGFKRPKGMVIFMNNYSNHINGEDLYNKLKTDILTLKLKPGQMISENEIASEYNVSRTPVKTAFLRLKGEKYIEIVPQIGSFVTLLDMKYIRDVIYMRAILEMEMLNDIIDNGKTQAVVMLLEENMSKQHELINSDSVNPSIFYDIDSTFHYTLFEANNHEKMMDIIQDCQVYYTRFRILDTATTERYPELYSEHETILSALKQEDKVLLRKAIFDHLHGNLQRLAPEIEGKYKDYFIQYE